MDEQKDQVELEDLEQSSPSATQTLGIVVAQASSIST
jgi:hypothetical protein